MIDQTTAQNLSVQASDDAALRALLHGSLAPVRAADPGTVVIDELGICRGQVRVDVALVNGHLHGFELKSARDTIRRLPRQVEFYSAVLDRATLVTTESHLAAALPVLPEWWGVRVVIDDPASGFRIIHHRAESANPHVDARALAELLWYDEALSLLEAREAARGVRGKARWVVWDRLAQTLSLSDLRGAVRKALKARSRQPTVPQQRLDDVLSTGDAKRPMIQAPEPLMRQPVPRHIRGNDLCPKNAREVAR